MQATLLQVWTEFKYYADKVIVELRAQGCEHAVLDVNLVASLINHCGDGIPPADAAKSILLEMNK